MLRRIYSAINGEVNVSVSGGYMLQYAGGTRASGCFIAITLKCWSGWKLLDPTTYLIKEGIKSLLMVVQCKNSLCKII
jgi:hypothetical protein